MERHWKIGRSFWRKPTENSKKRSEVYFWRGSEDCARKRERTERGGGVIGSKEVFVFGEENSRECGKSEKSE